MGNEKVGVNYEVAERPSWQDVSLATRLLEEGGIDIGSDAKFAKVDVAALPTFEDFQLMYPAEKNEDLSAAWNFITDEKIRSIESSPNSDEESVRWNTVIDEIRKISSDNLRKLTMSAFDTKIIIPWSIRNFPQDNKYLAIQDHDINYAVIIESSSVLGDIKSMPRSIGQRIRSLTMPTDLEDRHAHGGARIDFGSVTDNEDALMRFKMARVMGVVEKAWHSIPTKERLALEVHERQVGLAERNIGLPGRWLDKAVGRFSRGNSYDKVTGVGESYAFVWQLPGNTTTLENMPVPSLTSNQVK
jgi:hypothetical protein